jgi:membrane protein YqaA with SNARE-associated domain
MNHIKTFFSEIWTHIKGLHITNKKGGLYGYMGWNFLKIVGLYIIIIVPLLLLGKHLIDFNRLFHVLTDNFSDAFVVILFLASESLLGLIPPDLFLIWATKFHSPFLIFLMLGILSYVGGIASYWIGYWIAKSPKFKAYSERKLGKYILLSNKWGGAFIVIAALFPLSPFSMVVIATSLLKYPFRLYLVFGLSRIVRFAVQGLMYEGLFHLDSIFAYL